ncbi:MAG: GGDEF domain-containing protein, partial [Nitrospirae bacterium]|nr:GGDEF domain-containing protein [Nitrospirota bacterium]
SDTTRRRQLEEKLRTQSFTDELTGILNRRGFFTLMDYQLKIAARQNKEAFMLYTDVDNFKQINDTWGHQEGDRVLTETADILKETFRESDIIARIGGDEFVVFYAGTPYENFQTISERLQKALETHNSKHHLGYKPLLSAGIAKYDPEKPVPLDKLLYEAEDLMYAQKKQKKSPK